MSTETMTANEFGTSAGDLNANTMPSMDNEQTDGSSTNGLNHTNGNNFSEQQIESTKNAYDDTEQQSYNKSDLEPESLRKVFIGGLSYKTDDQGFREFFSKYGDIVVRNNHAFMCRLV